MANTLRFKRGLVSGIPTAALGEPLFTTDTFDLYIGNGTGNTRFQKYIASGTTSQLLRGDGSLYTFPLAISSPSAGQVLKYNGTSWVNDSDAGITGSGTTNYLPKFTGASTLGDSLVYDNGTNVGIGTTTPANQLVLNKNDNNFLQIRSSDAGNAGIYFGRQNDSVRGSIYYNNSTDSLHFQTFNLTTNSVIHSTGNFHVGGTSDNGLRFQVTGDGYFSGSVGIGTSTLTSINLHITKNISGSINSHSVLQNGTIQTDVTSSAFGFRNIVNTANSLTLGSYSHFFAQQGTIGTSNAITSQYGFRVDALTSATNNFGYFGDIASGTGRWNLYMNGTATNYLAGSLWIGTTSGNHPLEVASAGNTILYIRAGATSLSRLVFGTSTNADRGFIDYDNTSASRNMSFKIAETERMRLDASGNLGLGVTPSAWGSAYYKALELTGGALTSYQTASVELFFNSFDDASSSFKYKNTGFASRYVQVAGEHRWFTAPSGTAGAAITYTRPMTLFSTGNLAIGTTTDAGFRLDVNGTMRVSGASTFGSTIASSDNITITKGATAQLIINTTDATSVSILRFQENGTSKAIAQYINSNFATTARRERLEIGGTLIGGLALVADGNFTTPNLLISNTGAATFSSSVTAASLNVSGASTFGGDVYLSAANRAIIFNSSANLNTQVWEFGGSLRFLTGGATQLTIASTGAATFSSSVTAASYNGTSANVFSVGGTEGMRLTSALNLGLGTTNPLAKLHINNASSAATAFLAGNNAGGAYFGWDADSTTFIGSYLSSSAIKFGFNYSSGTLTEGMRLTTTGLGIGMTPSYKLDVTGEARVSNAIAIGTTPDTNKPFKVLKNINGTVGINFENTSTGSSAFSAIQMGTDVTGGTKFTNLVYASSGVTASGVYNPDGTSLINNGAGGLNFLGNPIRMYTGGSNGTLRWDMTNDGFITQYTGTNPTTSATDGYRQYSADVTAGNAAPHFRTENGAVIKLYQETTGVGNAIFSQGGGNSVLDDSTFDGYTLRQIVKALRNQGILA